MKLLIAGSRSLVDEEEIIQLINSCYLRLIPFDRKNDVEIISGHAMGIDRIGENWAKMFGYSIKLFHPDWKRYGKKAGYLRNEQMVENCDCAIIIWDGQSKGTLHTLNLLKKFKRPYILKEIK